MDKGKKLLLGGVVIAVFIGYLVFSGMGSSYGYATPAELEDGEKQGELVSVMGNVSTGSVQYDAKQGRLSFELEGNGTSIPVTYEGTLPANFGQGITIVAKGRYDGEKLVAEKLVVKCPSKYKSKGGELSNES